MAIEGILPTGFEAQSSQTDAVKPLIFWESPHPLSVVRVTYGCIVPLETTLSLPISEGSDMGEHVGFQTSGPDCGPHRGVRTTTERRTGPSAQRDRARGCHPAPVPA